MIISCKCVSTAISWSKWSSKINSVWLVDWKSDDRIWDSTFIEIVWTDRVFKRRIWALSINILTAQRRSFASLSVSHIFCSAAESIGGTELWLTCSNEGWVVYAWWAVRTLIYHIVTNAFFYQNHKNWNHFYVKLHSLLHNIY